MVNTATAQSQSYEVLEYRVELLFEEWGKCQRDTPSAWVRGYPGASPIARMIEDWGRRSDTDKRRPWAQRRSRRWIETGGRKHQIRPMVSERNDKDTITTVVPKGEAWPEHIHKLDRIIAGMPRPLLDAVAGYYIGQCSQRELAHRLRVGRRRIEERLGQARGYVVGRLNEVDE